MHWQRDLLAQPICEKNTFFQVVASVVQTRFPTLSPQLQIDSAPIIINIGRAHWQATANGCRDFLRVAQCVLVRINHCAFPITGIRFTNSSKIYRCWIVWGQNIHVVIIPSFLAIADTGQSSYLHHLKSRFQFHVSPLAIWLVGSTAARAIVQGQFSTVAWGGQSGYNKSHRVHGREFLGDGVDRVRDPQCVLGS